MPRIRLGSTTAEAAEVTPVAVPAATPAADRRAVGAVAEVTSSLLLSAIVAEIGVAIEETAAVIAVVTVATEAAIVVETEAETKAAAAVEPDRVALVAIAATTMATKVVLEGSSSVTQADAMVADSSREAVKSTTIPTPTYCLGDESTRLRFGVRHLSSFEEVRLTDASISRSGLASM